MKRTVLLIVLALAAIAGQSARGEDGELLRPVPDHFPSTQPAQRLTYHLSAGSDQWDADARLRITKAMDEAVAVYNKYGDFDRVLTANCNPGTPTADANFGGWINFGGQIGTRTALHEIAHTLGVGTCEQWQHFARNGLWTGKFAIAQLKELDGPDAVLHCDHQHFWPYGLNYDSEGGGDSFRRNVLMVTALRADMGLGPPPHPAAVALKLAIAEDQQAHLDLTAAQNALQIAGRQSQSSMQNRSDVHLAQQQYDAAKLAYETAFTNAVKHFQTGERGSALQQAADQARQRCDALQADAHANPDEVSTAAQAALDARSAFTHALDDAVGSDPQIAAARTIDDTAAANLRALQRQAIQDDPHLLGAKQKVQALRKRAATADRAVIVAQKAAAAEAAFDATKSN